MSSRKKLVLLHGLVAMITSIYLGAVEPNFQDGLCQDLVIKGVRTFSPAMKPGNDKPLRVMDFEFAYSCDEEKAVWVETIREMIWDEETVANNFEDSFWGSPSQLGVTVQQITFWTPEARHMIRDTVPAIEWEKGNKEFPVNRTVDIDNRSAMGSRGLSMLPLFAAGYGYEITEGSELEISDSTSTGDELIASASGQWNGLPVDHSIVFDRATGTIKSSGFAYKGNENISVDYLSETESIVDFHSFKQHIFSDLQKESIPHRLDAMILDYMSKATDSPQLNPELNRVTIIGRLPHEKIVTRKSLNGETVSRMSAGDDE